MSAAQERLLKREEVEQMLGIRKTHLYAMIERGEFPRPIRVGANAVRWKLSTVSEWIERQPVAA